MKVIRGLPIPKQALRTLYDFNSLQHGDAIDVASKSGAIEMFRRWRKTNKRNVRLASARDPAFPNRLFFIDNVKAPLPFVRGHGREKAPPLSTTSSLVVDDIPAPALAPADEDIV